MKILFVCRGNACRSAVAEVILRKMLYDYGISGVEVASCGTKFYGVLDRDETMCRIAAEHGYVPETLLTVSSRKNRIGSVFMICLVMSQNGLSAGPTRYSLWPEEAMIQKKENAMTSFESSIIVTSKREHWA